MLSPAMQAESDNEQFQSLWKIWLPKFEKQFAAYLDHALSHSVEAEGLARLCEAMCYSSLAGGKRLRALLVHLVYDCCAQITSAAESVPNSSSGSWQPVDRAGFAIELVHAYSLIHDDLPALDNDKLRRGKPTSHIQFDEATAILAGDALHSLAFECLSESDEAHANLTVKLIQHLARGSGALGMVGGQAIDIACENKRISIEQLTTLHRMKTGKLIYAAVMMGALCAKADQQTLTALERFGINIGLAFQVRDDIIDITSSSEKLGKTQGADLQADKSTFPVLLGLEGASQKAMDYYQNAIDALSQLGDEADPLRGLASFFVLRDR